jgi:predicted anti-sigma-YlaC factor YlaD
LKPKGDELPRTPPECRRLTVLIERHLDAELSDEHTAFVTGHLAECSSCRGRHRFQTELRRYVVDALNDETPPPGLVDRVTDALHAEDIA